MRHRISNAVPMLLALSTQLFASPSFGALKMFVTSGTHNGDFDGIANADAFCQSVAANATPPLSGTFRAWLSTSTDDAFCHVAGLSGEAPNCGQAQAPNAGPWVRVDGQPFARSLQALTISGQILTPPVIDEDGVSLVGAAAGPAAMTGTNFAGVDTGLNCSNWTLSSGSGTNASPFYGPNYWTNFGVTNCSSPQHYYCFEVGPSTPLPTFEYDGAMAFITFTQTDGDMGGVAGADELCRAEADGADLPNSSSFFAWLSDSNVSAASRLTHTGAFKRVDGVEIASSKADLFDAVNLYDIQLNTGIWKTAHDVTNFFFAWTGSTTTGTPASTCDDWTSNLNADHGDIGYPNTILAAWTNLNPTTFNCDAAIYYHYCFSNVPILFWDNFEEFPYLQRWSSVVP